MDAPIRPYNYVPPPAPRERELVFDFTPLDGPIPVHFGPHARSSSSFSDLED